MTELELALTSMQYNVPFLEMKSGWYHDDTGVVTSFHVFILFVYINLPHLHILYIDVQ